MDTLVIHHDGRGRVVVDAADEHVLHRGRRLALGRGEQGRKSAELLVVVSAELAGGEPEHRLLGLVEGAVVVGEQGARHPGRDLLHTRSGVPALLELAVLLGGEDHGDDRAHEEDDCESDGRPEGSTAVGLLLLVVRRVLLGFRRICDRRSLLGGRLGGGCVGARRRIAHVCAAFGGCP